MEERARKLLSSPIDSDRRKALTMIEQTSDLSLISAVAAMLQQETNPEIRRQAEQLITRQQGAVVRQMLSQVLSGTFDVEKTAVLMNPAPQPETFNTRMQNSYPQKEKRTASAGMGSLLAFVAASIVLMGVGTAFAFTAVITLFNAIPASISQFITAGEYGPDAIAPVYRLLRENALTDVNDVLLVALLAGVAFETAVQVFTFVVYLLAHGLGGQGSYFEKSPPIMAALLGLIGVSGALALTLATSSLSAPVGVLEDGVRIMSPSPLPQGMVTVGMLMLLVSTLVLSSLIAKGYQISFARGMLTIVTTLALITVPLLLLVFGLVSL